MDLTRVMTPALILDLPTLMQNVREMSAKARKHGVVLRPHAKTHKCPEIARLQLDHGAGGIAVATLAEARIFTASGINDITHAYPLDPGKIGSALELAEGTALRVTVDNLVVAKALAEAADRSSRIVGTWLKVDCGYHRAGVDPDGDYALQLAQFLHGATHIDFAGLLTHAGQSYQAHSWEELVDIAEQERGVMIAFRERLAREGIGPVKISIGSTPTISVSDSFDGVDEIRPGNYVFYDWTQVCLGSCRLQDCAVTVLATVVSHQPGGDHAVIDAGALALSHDPGPTQIDTNPSRGRIILGGNPMSVHPALRVTAVSQEHGIIRGSSPGDLEGINVGDRIRILPNHSCLTAALFDEYLVVENDEVVDRWAIHRARS